MTALPGSRSDSIKSEELVDAQKAETDLWNSTKFFRALSAYGVRPLLLTPGTLSAAVLAAGVVTIYAVDEQGERILQPLGAAFLSVAVAMFGVVLAALAVVTALFDEKYMATLDRRSVLVHSLFQFWWAASLAVLSIVASTLLLVGSLIWQRELLLGTLVGLASLLFFMALFVSLGRVGTLLRHAVYRARLK